MKEDCIFCKIIKGEAPSKKTFENDYVYVFESNQPVAETHTLIIPKKHYTTILDVDDAEIFYEMKKAVNKTVDLKNISNGYKLVFNGGRYQMVPHVHWHVLGGKLEDTADPLNNT